MTTPLQGRIYDYIRQYISLHGYSPSLQEIARGIGISPKSISLVSRSIHALVAAGRLEFHKQGYRNIQVAGSSEFLLPLMGRIAAGVPIEAIEERQTLDLGPLVKGEGHFVLEVKGDSMVEEGILEGDFVICRHAAQAGEGDIVVALVDEHDATLKRISYRIRDRVTLVPANPALKPKAYLPHRVRIQGVFIGLLRLKM
ncbi:LexA repressor [Aquicella siphonis]|uniref:LexA repressor n=1 Tax=Aquicella siphonis TaxID=254247 RepID=A0A5E4PH95_9COXI|nr:transcriptional repressor LexA [Aquicella siphonis]VVC75696.1 LexA repressor [Aquicella siphonis]